MALRGVRQLRELVIRYSDYDGSSKGIRGWMSNFLLTFAEKNPKLKITAEKVRCKHPFLRGNYANGNSKTICIKNADDEEIAKQILHLRNQIGRKVNEINLLHFSSQII